MIFQTGACAKVSNAYISIEILTEATQCSKVNKSVAFANFRAPKKLSFSHIFSGAGAGEMNHFLCFVVLYFPATPQIFLNFFRSPPPSSLNLMILQSEHRNIFIV